MSVTIQRGSEDCDGWSLSLLLAVTYLPPVPEFLATGVFPGSVLLMPSESWEDKALGGFLVG